MRADYVIVGAGSAGCAIAYRLAEAGKQVLVIEYGGSDLGPFIQMPAALSYPMNMKMYDWGLKTEPEPHLGGRTLVTPRGKVIAGSSSINGMICLSSASCAAFFSSDTGTASSVTSSKNSFSSSFFGFLTFLAGRVKSTSGTVTPDTSIFVEVAITYAGLTRRSGTPFTLYGPVTTSRPPSALSMIARLPRNRPARIITIVPGVREARSFEGAGGAAFTFGLMSYAG